MHTPADFPDPVAWAVGYLAAHLPNYFAQPVRVGGTYRGQGFEVTVRRDGGGRNDSVEFPRLGINVRGTKDAGELVTNDLARVVASLIAAASGDGPVRRVTQVSGPSEVADNVPRRFITCELMLRPSNLQEV